MAKKKTTTKKVTVKSNKIDLKANNASSGVKNRDGTITYSVKTTAPTTSKTTTKTTASTSGTKTTAQILADAEKQVQGLQTSLNESVNSGQIAGGKVVNGRVVANDTPVPTDPVTPESIAGAVAGATPQNAEGYTPTDVNDPVAQEQPTDTMGNVVPVQGGQSQGVTGSQGGQAQASVGNLQTPSVVDYLGSLGQASDFTSRKRMAEQLGVRGYTGTAQQNQQLLSSLRGAPVMPQEAITPTSAGAVNEVSNQAPVATASSFTDVQNKYGLQQTQNDFYSDPMKTISDITKQVYKASGLDQANSAIKDISEELEDLENDRDDELRAINDDPWLTEGVRLRQRAKVEEKWSDRIDSRVNKLGLLENVRDSAQQQAQWSVGTAISVWDSERKFQASQIQAYQDQAQREFDNAVKLQSLSSGASGQTTDITEYTFAVENGYEGSFFSWKNPTKVTGSSGGGGGTAPDSGSAGGIIDTRTGKPVKLTSPQVDTLSGFENIFSSADSAISLMNNGVKTGPIEGSFLQGAKVIGKGNPDQLKLEQILGKLKADYMKALSGAAVSDAEVIRLSKFLPDIYDQENVVISKLNTLKETANQQKTNYLRTIGASDGSGGSSYDSYLQSIR